MVCRNRAPSINNPVRFLSFSNVVCTLVVRVYEKKRVSKTFRKSRKRCFDDERVKYIARFKNYVSHRVVRIRAETTFMKQSFRLKTVRNETRRTRVKKRFSIIC